MQPKLSVTADAISKRVTWYAVMPDLQFFLLELHKLMLIDDGDIPLGKAGGGALIHVVTAWIE